MGIIRQLPREVSDLIAAGEVVERPAAAAKELIENALDAGATEVTVECQRGGVALLRVTDNGQGMLPEDAPAAFLPHATSKIQTAEDLGAVETLGFRGEALAAIAAVSRVSLLTRAAGQSLGYSLTLEGGRITDRREAGGPLGTTIVVRDLFFNTPARQKFLKKDATEAAHILAVVQRAALSHPGVSFRFLKDGKQVLHTPGDHNLRSCLYSLWGREFVEEMLEVPAREGTIQVQGYVGRPESAGGSRQNQHFFVCGRPVRARVLTAALEEAYKNRLTAGRLPSCVLHITLAPQEFDVNVHPAKWEIKFVSDRAIFDAVYYAVLSALTSQEARPQWSAAPRAAFHGTAASRSDAFVHTTAESFRAQAAQSVPIFENKSAAPVSYLKNSSQNWEYDSALTLRQPDRLPTGGYSPAPQPPPPEAVKIRETVAVESVAAAVPRLLGEVLGGYILAEEGDALVIIDRHAAHERMIYNRLKQTEKDPMAQLLMVPQTVFLPPQEAEILLEKNALLSSLGFGLEEFGPGSLLLREAPEGLDMSDLPGLLSEIARKLLDGRDVTRTNDEVLHLVACKAAVKLGRASGREEQSELVRAVLSDPDLRHCPHGRPVAVWLDARAMEKQFKR